MLMSARVGGEHEGSFMEPQHGMKSAEAALPEAAGPIRRGVPWFRLGAKLLVLAVILAALHQGARWAIVYVEDQYLPLYQAYGPLAIALVLGVYILLMSLPFMPGIEVALAIVMIFGAKGAWLVYMATLAALLLSFLAGRFVPALLLARLLGWLHLERARALVERLEPLTPDEKLALLTEKAPVRLLPFLLRHRYLAVAVAFNLPGNIVIGGGGGIALAAGLSGLFRLHLYVLMVALAISPVPLFVTSQAWWW